MVYYDQDTVQFVKGKFCQWYLNGKMFNGTLNGIFNGTLNGNTPSGTLNGIRYNGIFNGRTYTVQWYLERYGILNGRPIPCNGIFNGIQFNQRSVESLIQ